MKLKVWIIICQILMSNVINNSMFVKYLGQYKYNCFSETEMRPNLSYSVKTV